MSKPLIFFLPLLFFVWILQPSDTYAGDNAPYSIEKYKRSNKQIYSSQTYTNQRPKKKDDRSALLGPRVSAHKVKPVMSEELPIIEASPEEVLQGKIHRSALDLKKKWNSLFQYKDSVEVSNNRIKIPLPPRHPYRENNTNLVKPTPKNQDADLFATISTTQEIKIDLPDKNTKLIRIMYSKGKTQLDSYSNKKINSLAFLLKQKQSSTVQIISFSPVYKIKSNKGRRIAFARAVSIRNHLIRRGVNKNRIFVKVPEYESSDGLNDRVDIHLTD